MAHDEGTRLEDLLRRRTELDQRLARYKREFAVLFADIAGSTSFYERRGDLSGVMMVQQLLDHTQKTVAPLGGRLVKSLGDAVLVHFADPLSAVRAGVALQQGFAELNRERAEADRVYLRVGVSWGSGFLKEEDIFGDVVNLAARLEALARPGQIVISAALHAAARQLEGVRLRRLRDAELKGKAAPQEVYEVLAPGAPGAAAEAPAPPVYSLVLVEPGATATTTVFLLREPETLLGRDQGEIRFPGDSLISSLHARLRIDLEGLELEDLGATGVFLRLRAAARLEPGDRFLAGKKLFEFLWGKGEEGQLVLGHQSFPLRRPETLIGRREGDLVFPDDPLLSGRHARLRREETTYTLEDLGSTNGTFLKVRGRARLEPDDEILCGSKLLRVRAG